MSEIRTDTINNASGDNDSGIDLSTNDQVSIKTANTTALTVDASQNVGIGNSSPSAKLDVTGAIEADDKITIAYEAGASDWELESTSGDDFTISRNGSQKFIIDGSTSNVGIGRTPDAKISVQETGVATLANFYNTNGTTPYGIYLDFTNASPDDNSSYAFRFEDSTTDRFIIYSDGDIYNHDGTFAQISDRRIKDNITDANSQWDDIKAMRFVNYQRKDDIRQYGESEAKVQLGLIGQELEVVSPNLVRSVDPSAGDIISSSEFGSLYVEGDDIPEGKQVGDVKEVTDQVKGIAYSILYLKAVKALQEAMTRIETLETANTALEARITALENA